MNAAGGHGPRDDAWLAVLEAPAFIIDAQTGAVRNASPEGSELLAVDSESTRLQDAVAAEDRSRLEACLADAGPDAASRARVRLRTRRTGWVPAEVRATAPSPRDRLVRIEPVREAGELDRLWGPLLDTIPVMLTVYDPSVDLLEVNREFTRTLGWTAEDLGRPDGMSRVYPENAERQRAMDHMRTADGTWMELKVRTKAGEDVPSAWANIRLTDDRLVGIGIDRSALRAAREALAAVELRHSTAIAAGEMGAFEYDLVSGEVWWDARAREICGLDPDAALDFEGSMALIHPEDRAASLEAFEAAIAPGSSRDYQMEKRIVRPSDGEVRWVDFRGRCRFDASGRPVAVIGVIQDVDERHRRQEQATQHAVLLQSSNDAIIGHDDAGVRLWSRGAEALYGIPEDQALGRPLRELVGSVIDAVPRGRWSGELELEVDGRTRAIAVRRQLVQSGRAPPTTLEIHRDITEERAYREALERADRQKDDFLAMLGHELRNPLAAMSSAVEIQSAFPDRTEMVHRARDVLNRQVRHMTRLVDDLLSASRIVRGKLTLDLEPVEMRGLVQDVIEDHRSTLEAKDLALDARLPEQPTWVVGDPTRLAQAFGNLLTNAAQFTDPPGRVAVEMSVDGPAVQVAVRDTGRGLEPALLETVFEPFRQGQQGLDRKGGGLGLGLALTRGLVELMGGHADAESEGPGRGACFSIRLPITEARAQPGPPLRRVEPTRAGSVLIVEDNLDHAELLLELFRERGFSAEHTVNGRRAVERATAHPPALLICDIGLPDISGHEVARRLRPHLPDCRMVAVSGYARGQDRQRSEAAGFDAHLAKPVDVDRLIELFPPGATADLEPGNET